MADLIVAESHSIEASKQLNEELIARFTAYCDSSAKTIDSYNKALRQLFKYFAFNRISRPQREDIIAFRDDLKASGHKPTTVQNYITATRIFFSWTAQEGIYPNIADHVKGAKLDRNHKKDYLSSGQVKNVLNKVDKTTLQGLRDYAVLTLMITGGLRTIEVVRANIEDLRTEGGDTVLYVQGKGREEKTELVIISDKVEQAIRAYLIARGEAKGTEPLFASTSNNNRGKRLTTRSVSAIAKNSLKNAGYNSERLTAHSLRHTAVTLSLLAGKDITEVQQFARHANISTTMIYSHHLDAKKNSCSNAVADAIF